MCVRTALLLAGMLIPSLAMAQETVDIGTIKDDDVVVVQKLLYPKDDRSEMGVHLGVMPFDAYLVTPNLQLSFNKHFNEKTSFSLMVGGGYGLKNGTLRELEKPALGKTPDAYRYLGSVLVGVEYAPIYAKMNLNGARILHHDVYGVLRAGVTFESSLIEGFAPCPTVSWGVGTRAWVNQNLALRVELRDDMMIQRRKLTSSTHFKQNANITVGVTKFSAVKARGR